MLTDQEKKELEALRAKADKSDEENARLEALMQKEKAEANDDEKTYSEDYVKRLREENAKYRTKARDAESKLAKLENIDPDEYARLKELEKQKEQDKLKAEGEWDKLREQLVSEHAIELGKKDADIQTLKAQIESLNKEFEKTILSHEIAVQATVAKAINPQLVEMVALTQCRVDLTDDEKRVIRVLDAAGNERMDLKTGKPFSIAQLMGEMRESEATAHLFYGANTGANSNTVRFDGKSVANPWKKESLNLTLQGRILKENPALAARLKEEAEVA